MDTSVFGGCFDEEFEAASQAFFALVRSGKVRVLISPIVLDELAEAPAHVRGIPSSLPPESMVILEADRHVIELRDAYVQAGVVIPKSLDDATHVALATAARADAIVSWNFQQIVRIDKIRAYNQVNLMAGYGLLSIVSPLEVRVDDEDEDSEDI